LKAKFCDSLPFCRQEKQFTRIGLDLSRQDIAKWSVAVFEPLLPLRELLRVRSAKGLWCRSMRPRCRSWESLCGPILLTEPFDSDSRSGCSEETHLTSDTQVDRAIV
jgi:hypothetical protein